MASSRSPPKRRSEGQNQNRAPVTMREAAGLLTSFVKLALTTNAKERFAPEVFSVIQHVDECIRSLTGMDNSTEAKRRIVVEVLWGDEVEMLCNAIESAYFFGLDPPQSGLRGGYEYASADFVSIIMEIISRQYCTATLSAWTVVQGCGFVTSTQGRCRAWLRAALAQGELAIVTRSLGRVLDEQSQPLWRRASVVGDPRARLALCQTLVSLNSVRLIPRIDDPRLDQPLVAFDSNGVLRRLETRDATALEVTLAGTEALLGVYLIQQVSKENDAIRFVQHTELLASHAIECEDSRWLIRRSTQFAGEEWPVCYYTSSVSPWPPAAGWRCGPAGALPCPILRRVRFEPKANENNTLSDAADDSTADTVAITPSYEVPANSVVGAPSRLPRVRSRDTQCLAEVEDVISDDDTNKYTLNIDESETLFQPEKWRLTLEEHESRVASVTAKDEFRRALLRRLRQRLYEKLCASVVQGAVRAEESTEDAMRRWIIPDSQKIDILPETCPTLEAAVEKARERPQDLRVNEARRARQLWRSACVTAVRKITDGRTFVCVDIGCAGAAVVARSAVVWLVRIAIERGVPFFDDDDGLDLDSNANILFIEKNDDDPAETLSRRLDDGRLRRPRRVAVVRCSSRGLEALQRRLRGREESFPATLSQTLHNAEKRMLRRLDETNPLGRDRDITAAAAPAVQAVDIWLKELVFGEEKESEDIAVKLKLFVDDSYADEERNRSHTGVAATSSISLGLWLPLRTAGSASPEPPEPPSLSGLESVIYNDDDSDDDQDGQIYSASSSMANLTPAAKKMVKGIKRAASLQQHLVHEHRAQKLPLTFAESTEALLNAQGRRCACCGDEVLHVSSFMGNNFAPCRLLDVLVCTKRCHSGDRRVLPWRAVLCGDLKPHRVCRAAAAFLDARRYEPLLKVPPTAAIFRINPSVDAARQLRILLAEIRTDATLHGRVGATQASRLLISKLGASRIHLAINSPQFWSLQDLIDASQGHLISIMSDIIADANEVFASAFGLYQEVWQDISTIDNDDNEKIESP